MERNMIIIIALLAVILVLLAAIGFTTFGIGKQDTKLIFKSNDTIEEGGSIEVILAYANSTPLVDQTVNITLTDKDNSNSYYSVVTGEKGTGKVKLDKDVGEYDVTISYGGNAMCNGCNATQKLTIKEKVVETQTSSSSSVSSSSSSGSSSSSSSSGSQYDINNLPPTNDPYPETSRYYLDENYVKQEYADGYMRTVDIRTGEVYSNGFK